MRLPASATLDYGDPAGEPALRQAIAQHLRISRGVRCDASRIIVTEGAQGALDLCVQLLTNPGDHAWLEEPGYRGAKSAFAGETCASAHCAWMPMAQPSPPACGTAILHG